MNRSVYSALLQGTDIIAGSRLPPRVIIVSLLARPRPHRVAPAAASPVTTSLAPKRDPMYPHSTPVRPWASETWSLQQFRRQSLHVPSGYSLRLVLLTQVLLSERLFFSSSKKSQY